MKLPDYLIAIFSAWLILAVLGTAGWSFAVSRLKRRTVVPLPPYPPAVPPSRPRITQEDVDSTWLAAWPSDALEAAKAVQTAYAFEEIAEANKFHEFLPGSWSA